MYQDWAVLGDYLSEDQPEQPVYREILPPIRGAEPVGRQMQAFRPGSRV